MATHLQVFALSDWLAVSLPVEYRETTRGLRWLIPHVNPPWQSQHNYTSVRNPLFERQLQPQTPMMRASVRARRTLLSDGEFVRLQAEYESAKIVENSLLGGNARFHTTELSECLGSRFPSHCRKKTVPGHLRGGQISPSFWNETRAVASCIDRSRSGRRRLGTNMTLFGPALTPSEYSLYFEVDFDLHDPGMSSCMTEGRNRHCAIVSDSCSWTNSRNRVWLCFPSAEWSVKQRIGCHLQ